MLGIGGSGNGGETRIEGGELMADYPCIFAEYDKALDDCREAVARAYEKHGYRPGECVVICCPRGSKSLKMALAAKPLDIYKLLAEETNHG